MTNEPQTLIEAVRYFANPDTILKTIIELRWPDGVTCPSCGSKEVRFITTRRVWECKNKHPKKQFSAKVGTIFEDSALPLGKWFVAIWAVANCKNGISSYELHRALGITQKSAWFMLHRIRLAMKAGSIMTSHGQFEVDESLIGGLETNMHANRRTGKKGRGTGKAVVMAIVRRKTATSHSKVKTAHIKDASQGSLQSVIADAVEPGAHVFTDKWKGYRGLSAEYRHDMIDHAVQYVRGISMVARIFSVCLSVPLRELTLALNPSILAAILMSRRFASTSGVITMAAGSKRCLARSSAFASHIGN